MVNDSNEHTQRVESGEVMTTEQNDGEVRPLVALQTFDQMAIALGYESKEAMRATVADSGRYVPREGGWTYETDH